MNRNPNMKIISVVLVRLVLSFNQNRVGKNIISPHQKIGRQLIKNEGHLRFNEKKNILISK